MNQRERARHIWLKMRERGWVEGIKMFVIPDLDHVLDEAQNEPPLGEADGSLSKEEWTALRTFTKASKELVRAYEEVMNVTKRKVEGSTKP